MSILLLSPVVFFSMLAVIFIASTIAALSLLRKEEKTVRQIQEEAEKYRARISELQAALVSNHEDYKEKLSGFEETLKSKEKDFAKNTSLVQEQLKIREELRQELTRLQAQLSEKEVFFKKEITAKDALEKSLREELFLNRQMYDGLKDQYSELEVSTERLLERIQRESDLPEEKKAEPVQPASS